jgi:succinate dehydrogenase / fumarate reductase, iron-sulfur subunit
MKITFRIRRYNPEEDAAPHFEDYELEMAGEDKVLDALLRIKSYVDGSLAFRKSCGHGICGSDAMVINDEERLACKTLIRDLKLEPDADGKLVVKVEPLKGLPLQRDLMVDQEPFFSAYRSVKPFLINPAPVAAKERKQSQEERALFDDATKCILCASCYSSCPVIREKNPDFMGPAAVLGASRFAFDSRDSGFAERLPALDREDGIWDCENRFRCTQVCPRGIKVTKAINATKRKIESIKKGNIVQ